MPDATDKLIARKDGAIGRLVFNQPERRNAISFAMWRAIPDAVAEFVADDAIRVIVVSGAGGKAFSAGNDISEFATRRASNAQIADYNAASGRAYAALAGAPKPVIAKIEGYCIGGGLEVSQLCDLQLSADDARFAVTPARLGLGYKYDDVRLLLANISAKHAKELLFTGRQFSAADALRMGLVNRVAPAAALDDLVEDYARGIAGNAPLSVRAAKGIVAEAVKPPADADLARCQALVDACHASADYQEGQRAFGEKRKPRFEGR